MTPLELFNALIGEENLLSAQEAVEEFLAANPSATWHPLGDRGNNRGTVEVATSTGRALVERITNATDAVLEYEHESHRGQPECRSPREAASAWLNLPDGGLAALTPRQRQSLANRIVLSLLPGDGPESRLVDVLDQGVGVTKATMPTTILSLNESNKITKHYLSGIYGQGGSATFAACGMTLIASRKHVDSPVAFTVVQYQERPPDIYKSGLYVYLVLNDQVLECHGDAIGIDRGTRCRHFGYDLTKFKSPIGPNSVYGLLQQVLFDPVIPIWFNNRINDYRRVIKGSRNALNGAVDEGDDNKRGPKLDHSIPMFYVNLREFGRIGIEYWVLPPGNKENKKPSAAFVDPAKPIILSFNGQNQAEMTVRVIRKEAELPYLAQRLICHVECNHLSPLAQRMLFASGREEARGGQVHDLIENELVRTLISDDRLLELNRTARDELRRQSDTAARETMQKEVARILKLQGLAVTTATGAVVDDKGNEHRGVHHRRGRRDPVPITVVEPPTFIRIVGPADRPMQFYPEQRRYIRIETDAGSSYHDPANPVSSRINVVVDGRHLNLAGTTPLKDGRMRLIVDCHREARIDEIGLIQVELSRPALATLSDSHNTVIVTPPKAKPKSQQVELPRFDVRPVYGPEDQTWTTLAWPDNVNEIASSTEEEDGQLIVYYSTEFPRFTHYRGQFERKEATLSQSFVKRYEIWLAVHSLILYQDQKMQEEREGHIRDDDDADDRQERCRAAILSAMFAAKEVLQPESRSDD